MPRPTIINLITFYYPIGNTPAVCLTQDLSPEGNADILLLGCGDFRNILFTAYADSAPNTRRLDFTCCDIEGAIIARNILAFTLLLDDVDGQQHSNIWQIYYHLYLDDKSIRLLQAQAKKLSRLAETLESWKDEEYGRTLIFCDEGTFAIVKNLWNEYAISNRSKNEQAKYYTRFKVGIEDSVGKGKHFLGSGTNLTSLRWATTLCMDGIYDSPKVFDHFWKHGTTDRNPTKLPKDTRPNPTFVSRETDTFTLHYGTDPQLGFPLATAYVPLTKNSPLATEGGIRTDFHRITDAARTHFLAWSKAFRKSAKNFTLRFFVGDATAFSHTLQHVASAGDVNSHWYRNKYTVQNIGLLADDYASSGSSPVLFDVIETSNLLDHLGPINVLVAVVPLLKRQATSTLYTESLVAREKNRKDLMDGILCGSFPTMSLLLGLVPIEYWTNTTALSNTAETILETSGLLSNSNDEDNVGQMQCRIMWKASIPNSNQTNIPGRKLHFDPTDLAILIHRTYQAMFKHEDMKAMFSLSVGTLLNNSYPMYHRGSFATFLRFLQGRVDTNWDKTMELVLDRIANDKTIMMGLNYFQDLCAHIYLLGIYNVPEFTTGCRPADAARFKTGLGSWNHLSPVVCITLEVPRAKLKVILDVPRNELGTPNVRCCVQADVGLYSPNAWQNTFADVHLSFGTLITTGEPTEGDHKVLIHEDPLGWTGNCPLLVSFNVPTWVILRDPSKTIVSFGIQNTLQSSATFIHRLGFFMNIAEAKLLDNSSVHITKFHPQQAGYTSVATLVPNFEHGNLHQDFKATVTANVDRNLSFISGFTGRLDFQTEKVKALLLRGGSVSLNQISPTTISVAIGSQGASFNLNFPVPVLSTQSKTRIARKSSYIEVIVPTADHVSGQGFTSFMYPMYLRNNIPVLSKMPYLNLGFLPAIDVSREPKGIDWLNAHTAMQISAREQTQREQALRLGTSVTTDARTNYKERLHFMFMRFCGVQEKRANLFSLTDVRGGGPQIIVLVSRLLLDIANHTVVLDCAVIRLTHQARLELEPFLCGIGQVERSNFLVKKDEMKLWRGVLPALLERCRDWKHLPNCEYKVASKVPLSTEEDDGQIICSCGNGKFPDKFITGVPNWALASKFSTRAAISPAFPVSYVEGPVNVKDLATRLMNRCKNCCKENGEGGVSLLKCSRCLKVWYCSPECQGADWREHKKTCKSSG